MKFGQPSGLSFPHSLGEGLWVVGNYHFNLYAIAGAQATALVEVGISAVVDPGGTRAHRLLAVSDAYPARPCPDCSHSTPIPTTR